MRVFAYGSLLWNPGFTPVASEAGRVSGWRRSWCVESKVHRGTAERPGIVLGLVPGGVCTGVVYTVDPRDAAVIGAYLDQRELCEPGYTKTMLEVETSTGSAPAVAYVSSGLPHETAVEPILCAKGVSGSNLDYAVRTLEALEALVGCVSEDEAGLCATSLRMLRDAAPGPRPKVQMGREDFRVVN